MSSRNRPFLIGIAVALIGRLQTQSQEVCNDRLDNDGDGFLDCADLDCCRDRVCLEGCLAFKRGDVDGDGKRTVTDAILVLRILFIGELSSQCSDAADLDDNGTLDVADAIYLLRYVFQGGPAPPPPFLQCGGDTTQSRLGCFFRHMCN